MEEAMLCGGVARDDNVLLILRQRHFSALYVITPHQRRTVSVMKRPIVHLAIRDIA